MLFLWLCVLLSVAAAKKPTAVRLSLDDVDSMMVAQWTSSKEPKAVLKWGTSEDSLSSHVLAESQPLENPKKFTHTAIFGPVKPGVRYYYQCGGEKRGFSKVFSFNRPVNEDGSVVFYTYGDMGVHFDRSAVTLNALAKEPLEKADFIFHAGDLAYAFKNMTRWKVFTERIEAVASQVPYLVCVGNRDDVPDVEKRFRMPLRENSGAKRNLYYSFTRGPIYGIVMAVGGQVSFEEDSEQYKWMLRELEIAKGLKGSPDSEVSWIVVWAHTPIYSSSDGHKGGNKEMREVYEKHFVSSEVALIIAGDDHVYERSFPRFQEAVEIPPTDQVVGVDTLIVDAKYPVSFTVGTGGIDLDGWQSKSERPIWSAHRELHHGFLKVVATVEVLTTSFVRASDHKVLDVMHLQHSAPKSPASRRGLWFPQLLVVACIGSAVYFYFMRRKAQPRFNF